MIFIVPGGLIHRVHRIHRIHYVDQAVVIGFAVDGKPVRQVWSLRTGPVRLQNFMRTLPMQQWAAQPS